MNGWLAAAVVVVMLFVSSIELHFSLTYGISLFELNFNEPKHDK